MFVWSAQAACRRKVAMSHVPPICRCFWSGALMVFAPFTTS